MLGNDQTEQVISSEVWYRETFTDRHLDRQGRTSCDRQLRRICATMEGSHSNTAFSRWRHPWLEQRDDGVAAPGYWMMPGFDPGQARTLPQGTHHFALDA